MATKKPKKLPSKELMEIHLDNNAAKSIDIVERILFLMKEKELNKTGLADQLGKEPSEISKWLSGSHNFTISTLTKIEAALGGDDIFAIPSPKLYEVENFISQNVIVEFEDINPKLCFYSGDFDSPLSAVDDKNLEDCHDQIVKDAFEPYCQKSSKVA